MHNFQAERLALAGFGYATAEVCLADALTYARERRVFGKPVIGFQVSRHKLAQMATRLLGAKTLAYRVAADVAAGRARLAEVAMAKNLCAEVALEVSYEAVQLFGGMGYMRETRVERLARDARILPIGGGTQELMNEIIAKTLGF